METGTTSARVVTVVLPSSNVKAMIHRVGRRVTILQESVVAVDEFNNPQHDWIDASSDSDDPIKAIRTYPNRNRQQNSNGGPRQEDRALFMFTLEQAPDEGARVKFNSNTYELGSPTRYDTHVTFFGDLVSN